MKKNKIYLNLLNDVDELAKNFELNDFEKNKLVNHVVENYKKLYKPNSKKLACYKCGVLLDVDELDENGAYTYPDGKPFCPDCQPKE